MDGGEKANVLEFCPGARFLSGGPRERLRAREERFLGGGKRGVVRVEDLFEFGDGDGGADEIGEFALGVGGFT